MGNDGRQKTLMLPLLLSRGHGRSESSLAEEPTIKGSVLRRTYCPKMEHKFRFGSLADIGAQLRDFRFTPQSRHADCPDLLLLCANSRHRSL
jgi:hypothetical protein